LNGQKKTVYCFLQEKAGEILLLPFLLASVPKEKVAPKEKDFRPRYAKFAMQLLRLGSGELTLTLKAIYFTNPFLYLKNIPLLFIQGEGSNNTALTPRLRRHCLHFAPLWRVYLAISLQPYRSNGILQTLF